MSSAKSIRLDSPKTAGGISKSLLTPCRRVGLSRNWRKSGPSPFVSPLSGSTQVTPEPVETRKRKNRNEEKHCQPLEVVNEIENDGLENDMPPSKAQCSDIVTTPLRHTASISRKKSKVSSLIKKTSSKDLSPDLMLNKSIERFKTTSNADVKGTENKIDINIIDSGDFSPNPQIKSSQNVSNSENIKTVINSSAIEKNITDKEDTNIVSTPVILKSKSRSKLTTNTRIEKNVNTKNSKVTENIEETILDNKQLNTKPKSPENLTKECIVVIQKKIFKNVLESNINMAKKNIEDYRSQELFDSDSDDIPLNVLNKKEESQENLKNEGDFIETTKIKVKKLENKTTSTTSLNKSIIKKKDKTTKVPESISCFDSKLISQNDFDDDEDFVIDNKRTILIRKSYDKVSKLSKAKSTGSITQKDIDDLKARIETKKEILLAKASSTDTVELMDLIKKWQRGCQDALVQLMDLMKAKLPDSKNMDYAEILQTLKIPADLVGYDEDNDCFNTPSNENIILPKLK